MNDDDGWIQHKMNVLRMKNAYLMNIDVFSGLIDFIRIEFFVLFLRFVHVPFRKLFFT